MGGTDGADAEAGLRFNMTHAELQQLADGLSQLLEQQILEAGEAGENPHRMSN
jgi:hypothetical protein